MRRLTALACVLAGWLPRRRKRRGGQVTLTITGDASAMQRACKDAERAIAAIHDDGPNHFRGERE